MKHIFLILTMVALALPATALGKGPSGATIEGPGDGGGMTFMGGRNSGLFNLTEQTGLFPAVSARRPDPMLDRRPNGDLGAKYTITWTVPGPNNETWKLKQELYPYAESGPVTYVKPGQTVFRIPGGTRGGWFQADSRLKKTLVAAGLPSRPVADASDTTSLNTNLFSVLAVALFLVAATAVFLRRRARPATA
jgi:hypothetical protein